MARLIILFILILTISVFGASLIYKFAKWVNKPTKARGVNAIIPVFCTSTDIEQQVRFYCFGNNIERIILLNLGANPDIDHICRLLSRQNDFVYYCSSLDDIGVALNG